MFAIRADGDLDEQPIQIIISECPHRVLGLFARLASCSLPVPFADAHRMTNPANSTRLS
jgi:hypothetical protein